MLVEQAGVDDALPYASVQAHPSDVDLARARGLLEAAQRPLVLVGGAPWSADAHAALTGWCEASGLPVAAGWRCQDYVDNTSAAYVGHVGLGPDPRLAQRVRDADVLLVIGERLAEITTSGYTLLEVPTPRQALIHVNADPEELGRVYRPTLAINAAAGCVRGCAVAPARARRLAVACRARAGPRGVSRQPASTGACRARWTWAT